MPGPAEPFVEIEGFASHPDPVRALVTLAYKSLPSANRPHRVVVRTLPGGKSGSFVYLLREYSDTAATGWRVAKLGYYSRIRRECAAGDLLRARLGSREVPAELLLPAPGTLVPATDEDAKTYRGFGLHLSQYAGGGQAVRSLEEAFASAISDSDAAVEALLVASTRLAELLHGCFYANPRPRDGAARAWFYVRRCPDAFIQSEDFDPSAKILLPLGNSPAAFESHFQEFLLLCQQSNSPDADLVDRHVALGPLAPSLFEGTLYLDSPGIGRVRVLSRAAESTAYRGLIQQLETAPSPPPYLNIIGPVRRTRFSILSDAFAHLHPSLATAKELPLGNAALRNPLLDIRGSLFDNTPTVVALGHGDLHGGNVLLVGDVPFVIDFGAFSVDESGEHLEYPVQSDLARLSVRLAATVALHCTLEQLATVWAVASYDEEHTSQSSLAHRSPLLARLARILRRLRQLAAKYYKVGNANNDWWACIFGECLRLGSGGDPSYEAEATLGAAAVAANLLAGRTLPTVDDLLAHQKENPGPVVAAFAWPAQESEILSRMSSGNPFVQPIAAAGNSILPEFVLRLRHLAISSGWSWQPLGCSVSWRRDSEFTRDALWMRFQRSLGRLVPTGKPGDWESIVSWAKDNLGNKIALVLDDPLFAEIPAFLLNDLGTWLSAVMMELKAHDRLIGVFALNEVGRPWKFRVAGVPTHPALTLSPYTNESITACLVAHGEEQGEAAKKALFISGATSGDPITVERLFRMYGRSGGST